MTEIKSSWPFLGIQGLSEQLTAIRVSQGAVMGKLGHPEVPLMLKVQHLACININLLMSVNNIAQKYPCIQKLGINPFFFKRKNTVCNFFFF